MNEQSERRAQIVVGACFLITMAAGAALLLVYALGGHVQVEGALLFLALGALGAGFVVWSRDLIPNRLVAEARHELASDPEVREAVADALRDERGISRRKWLLRMMLGALAALGAALAIPVLSLGPSPGNTLFRTAWREGLPLVDPDGNLVNAARLPVGSLVTVFPQGADYISDADSAAVLINTDPDGFVCFSKLCTHAGCPVGLFLAERRVLVCPCHQSVFDVARGAVPVEGPAARPLPRLPIRQQPDGTFVATGDFEAPVGPSFWSVHQ